MTNKYDYIDSLVLKAQQGDGKAKQDLCECFRPLVYKLSKTAYETIEVRRHGPDPLAGISGKTFSL